MRNSKLPLNSISESRLQRFTLMNIMQRLKTSLLQLKLNKYLVFKSISDAQGSLVVQEVAVKPLTQDLLKTEV